VIAALVPAKAADASKSRLREDLSAHDVEQLATALLRDVLTALLGARTVDRVVVATPDPGVARVARAAGADAIVRDDPDLNTAIERASDDLVAEGADAVLVVLGDVAGARSDDIDQLIRALTGDGVALAPAHDGGTAALLRRPPAVIAADFGPDSAKNHRDGATLAGIELVELALPSLAIDVDRRDDLEALLAGDSPATFTRAAWQTIEAGSVGG
jgi:2-phospho-L-lactate guanylyltransferase